MLIKGGLEKYVELWKGSLLLFSRKGQLEVKTVFLEDFHLN